MPVTTRRRFLATALATGATPLFGRVARAQTAVKIGSAVLGDYSMAGPVIVALDQGYFKSEGLTAEYVPFRGGPDLLKAVMAGECLIGITGSTDIFVFREAGSPIKMIATHTEGNHFTLNVAPDVQKVADLRGKTIGVTRVGATTWVFARMVAKKEGWDPDKDVQIVGLGGLDAIRKSQKALFRAIKLMRDNPKEAAQLVSKKLGWTPEAVLGAHKISGPLLPVDGSINVEALAVMQDTLLEYGLIKKKLPLDACYTREFTPVRI
jgi:ABC-type nitrate/sulfonate/bicarbonate transport system substrate-binding protein